MVAEAIQWVIHNYFDVGDSFHYLDDVFFAGPSATDACLNALLDMLTFCEAVQAPLKPEKVIGPSTVLTLLGIELDSFLNWQAGLCLQAR